MSWQDRIREAAYTAPSGQRMVFSYEDVGRSIVKKTTAFEFANANGTFVQDNGVTGRRYPLRVFIWGDDYDQQTEQFEGMLAERGRGRLEHPVYGALDVVPTGEISRRDDLKTSANQAVIEVVFFETIRTVYPLSQADPASEVAAAVAAFEEGNAAQFAEDIETETAVGTVTFREKYEGLLTGARSLLQPIADAQENVRTQFNAIADSINEGLNVLVEQPATLAFQTSQLLTLPGLTAINIRDKFDAYTSIIQNVFSDTDDSSNGFQTNSLYATNSISALIVSALNTQFTTRPEAIAFADSLIALFDTVNEWREQNFDALGEIDTGQGYQGLQDAVAVAAGFLVELSFDLAQERSIILDRERTIIDLCAELYGEVDERLDFMIDTNELSGDEIIELPKGRRIVYYV